VNWQNSSTTINKLDYYTGISNSSSTTVAATLAQFTTNAGTNGYGLPLQPYNLYEAFNITPGALPLTANLLEFEVTDHLGNVRAVVSGAVPTLVNGQRIATILSLTDYYPFGSKMPGRQFTPGEYRFGYNGKETDTETGLENYGARMYNPSIARFFNVDPYAPFYPELSTYQYASNSPVSGVDIDGLEIGQVNATLNLPLGGWNPALSPGQNLSNMIKNSSVNVGVKYGYPSAPTSPSATAGLEFKKMNFKKGKLSLGLATEQVIKNTTEGIPAKVQGKLNIEGEAGEDAKVKAEASVTNSDQGNQGFAQGNSNINDASEITDTKQPTGQPGIRPGDVLKFSIPGPTQPGNAMQDFVNAYGTYYALRYSLSKLREDPDVIPFMGKATHDFTPGAPGAGGGNLKPGEGTKDFEFLEDIDEINFLENVRIPE